MMTIEKYKPKMMLDEVIKTLGYCNFSTDCNPCPYKEVKDCTRAKVMDALYYLKIYKIKRERIFSQAQACNDREQRLQEEIARYQEAVKNCELAENKYRQLAQNLGEVGNDPLTWEQLKQMEGKPVFIEERYRNGDLKSSGWWLIDFWNDDQICMRDSAGNPWNEHRSYYGYGRDWQAYRKERTDG